jgi:hypothetical protein
MTLEMLLQKSQNQIICPPPNAGIAQAIGAQRPRSVIVRVEDNSFLITLRHCEWGILGL